MHRTSHAILFPLLLCLSAWLPARSPAAGSTTSGMAAPTLEDEARASLAASSKEVQALERSASEKFRRHDYRGAEADCDRLVASFPHNARAYVYRGLARELGGNPSGATADFDRAIALDPNGVPQAYLNRGNIKAKKNDPAGAAADYRRALQGHPDYAPAHTGLGNLKEMQKDWAGAEAEYTAALKLAPKDSAAACNRAAVRYRLGRYAEARADADRAVSLKPDDAYAYVVRGVIEHQQDNDAAALSDYRHALQLDPTRKKTYHGIAHIEADQHRYSEALADVQRAIPASTLDDEDYSQLLAWTLRKHLGRGDEADRQLSTYFAARRHTARGEWAGHVGAFLLGREPEEKLYAQAASGDAKKAGGQLCEAYYYAGLKKLFAGDKAGAAERFHQCVATDQKTFSEYKSARSELQSL